MRKGRGKKRVRGKEREGGKERGRKRETTSTKGHKKKGRILKVT